MTQGAPLIQLFNAALAPLAPRHPAHNTPSTPTTLTLEIRKGIEILSRIHTPSTAWKERQELRAHHRRLRLLVSGLSSHSKNPSNSKLATQTKTLTRLAHRVIAIPGVAPILRPELSPVLATLQDIPRNPEIKAA